jgi:hypothetical protein
MRPVRGVDVGDGGVERGIVSQRSSCRRCGSVLVPLDGGDGNDLIVVKQLHLVDELTYHADKMPASSAWLKPVAFDALCRGDVYVSSVAQSVYLSDVGHCVWVLESTVPCLLRRGVAVWSASDAEVAQADNVLSSIRPEGLR